MSQRVVGIDLLRDGQCTSWGFRMSGGMDIGTPLLVQRVSMGSPSEGELHRGDIILSISGQDARRISHQKAIDLIGKAGNALKLMVARTTGAPTSPSTSPTPPLPLLTQQGTSDYFKPLPRTEFPQHSNTWQRSEPEKRDEKTIISTQAYRTLPLFTPTLKATKDMPTGSYLRHSRDTSGRSTGSSNNPYMLTRIQEAILEAAFTSPRASISSSRTSTPDVGHPNVTVRQYNSPINLYSQQALVETLNEQVAKSVSDLPRVQSPTPLLDLTKSPTFRRIQEEEQIKLEKGTEQQPVETKVHDLHEVPRDAFGGYDDIHQSGSFKVLMATLKGAPVV